MLISYNFEKDQCETSHGLKDDAVSMKHPVQYPYRHPKYEISQFRTLVLRKDIV